MALYLNENISTNSTYRTLIVTNITERLMLARLSVSSFQKNQFPHRVLLFCWTGLYKAIVVRKWPRSKTRLGSCYMPYLQIWGGDHGTCSEWFGLTLVLDTKPILLGIWTYWSSGKILWNWMVWIACRKIQPFFLWLSLFGVLCQKP